MSSQSGPPQHGLLAQEQGGPALERELVNLALEARKRAYAPYSRFQVGAAIRTTSGRVYLGCNVENGAFPMGICAERGAVCAAVAAGERSFTHIAVVGDLPQPITPCGACRQVLAEVAPGIRVVMANTAGALQTTTIAELLPGAFSLPPGPPVDTGREGA
jgi:cytidine deaminase